MEFPCEAEILPLLLSVLKALQSGSAAQKRAAEGCLKDLRLMFFMSMKYLMT